jgi:hypothetical protein
MRHVKTVTKRHPVQAMGGIWEWFQNLNLCIPCYELPFVVQLLIPWYCPDAWRQKKA